MGIENFIKRIATDTAVYWASPTMNTDGTNDFDDGVEIDCYWKEEKDLVLDDAGKEVVSRAKVYVTQDLDNQGMLYHGTLADLTAAQIADPKEVTEAYEIKQIVKKQSLHLKDEYVRQVML